MSQKFALIIGNNEYDDSSLARLNTPTADVEGLATILKSTDIGGFDEVVSLVNEQSIRVRREIARFFRDKHRDDLLLLYFSGHGVLDDHGKLYLAVKDTERDLLKGTAIEASFITDVMDSSYSRQQVLILDCCHSGAFARGTKGVTGASVGTAQTFEGTGSGRVVLTATDATQYAWEGDQVIGRADNSVFTHFLIEGLQTGEADTNADGRITLDELYDYAHTQVVKVTPKQNPRKWSFNQEGEIVIAKNPHTPVPKPVELSIELRQAIESPLANVREGAVRELDRLLNGSNAGLSLAAYDALKHLADDDSRRVSAAASASLTTYTEKQRAREELAKQRAEEERLAREKAEQERLVKEKAEAERRAALKAEEERFAREQAERARLAKEKAEAERLAALKAEEERLARQRAEEERLAREKAEQERLAQEMAEDERRAALKAKEEQAALEQSVIEEITDTAKRIAVPATRAQLVVKRGPDAGKSFALKAGSNIIGRVSGLDVTITDTLISRRHVRIMVLSDRITLEDLGSANGTFVNEQRVSGATPITLKDGDSITIGDTTLEFGAAAIEAPIKPVEPQPIETAQPEMISAAPARSIAAAIARPTILTALGFGVTWGVIAAIAVPLDTARIVISLITGLVIPAIILGLMMRSLGVPLKWQHFVALIIGWAASMGIAYLITGLIVNLVLYGRF